MAQRINLVFQKDFTKLAGNKYGKGIYQSQVKNIINFDEEIIFGLPIAQVLHNKGHLQ